MNNMITDLNITQWNEVNEILRSLQQCSQLDTVMKQPIKHIRRGNNNDIEEISFALCRLRKLPSSCQLARKEKISSWPRLWVLETAKGAEQALFVVESDKAPTKEYHKI
tara:strand:+ start:3116 stop:3442 length:327 start_codon:yes stop_codon:yes gene_type:complete